MSKDLNMRFDFIVIKICLYQVKMGLCLKALEEYIFYAF